MFIVNRKLKCNVLSKPVEKRDKLDLVTKRYVSVMAGASTPAVNQASQAQSGGGGSTAKPEDDKKSAASVPVALLAAPVAVLGAFKALLH